MILTCTLLWPNINLEKIYNFRCVKADAIIFNFKIVGVNLTNYAIRGEVYDLNTSIRLANTLGGAASAPEIVVTYTSDEYSTFTATVASGLTATMQPYGQVEFSFVDNNGNGNKTTILQQSISFWNERIIWLNETQGVNEDDTEYYGQNPLF